MSTARAMQRQNQLLRAEGKHEGQVIGRVEGERIATTQIVEYLKRAIPASEKGAVKALADVEEGKHKPKEETKVDATTKTTAEAEVDVEVDATAPTAEIPAVVITEDADPVTP